MKIFIKRAIAASVVLAGGAAFGYSNPIDGGDMQMVTNHWNVGMPWLMVGGNTASNFMMVTDGGAVNSQIGTIGHNLGSDGNMALVSGTNAAWNSSMELNVGHLGAGNALAVMDGGQVDTPNLYIGRNSTSNSAIVWGESSALNADTLYVGHQGAHNLLGVMESGTVHSADATLGYWIGSDNNAALVSGEGSRWTNSGALNVGNHGAENMLFVSDGGMVQSDIVNLGVQSLSSNNLVFVHGTNSQLYTDQLNIGGTASTTGGAGNDVRVSDGGTVSLNNLTVHSGNAFNLNDGGILVARTNFNAGMDGFSFNAGGTLEVQGKLTGMGSSIEDQHTVILNGSNALWNNGYYNLLVEENSSLVVSNGAKLLSGDVEIGSGGSVIQVVGTDSLAQVGNVRVGGDASRLIIDKGGVLTGGQGYVGPSISSGSTALIQGDGSVWSNKFDLHVGYFGANNILQVSEGGCVYNRNSYIGRSQHVGDNRIEVSGLGSKWINNGLLVLGDIGSENAVNVTDGGQVFSLKADIGRLGNDNSFSVSGVGSEWNNHETVCIGFQGNGNHLIVNDGGWVKSTDTYIGYESIAENNYALISGEGSVWQNYEGLYLGGHKSGTNWVNGGTGNSLSMLDGGWVLVGDVDTNNLPDIGSVGGLVVGDASGDAELIAGNRSLLDTAIAYVGLGSNESGSVTLAGGTQMDVHGRVYVGYEGSGSELNITEGGRIINNGSTYVGRWANAGSNQVVVSGDSSILTNRLGMSVGYEGDGNSMYISDGGRVYSHTIASVGREIGADGNSVEVTGTGSLWSNESSLYVGREGSRNELFILDGAMVENGRQGYIGYGSLSSNNMAVVAGTGSVWNASVVVGSRGDGNSLVISNGAHVAGISGTIGGSSSGNTALVTGVGSVWSNSGSMIVGNAGSGNRLEITDGAHVYNDWGYIGDNDTANNSLVAVAGSSSVWINSEDVYVGYAGSESRLEITGGAHVESKAGRVGVEKSSSNNTVLVSGSGSQWNNQRSLSFGYEGAGNELLIEDGGQVVNLLGGNIGVIESASNNSVVVTGVGSLWSIEFSLSVGERGSGNRLTISDGGVVSDSHGLIGYSASASNNTVQVTDENSRWLNSRSLVVGQGGSGNALIVEDGAEVHNNDGVLGWNIGSDGNSVQVTGDGSIWNNRYILYVGRGGDGNTLDISDGGKVYNTWADIGSEIQTRSNAVYVTGAGSEWHSSEAVQVGFHGSGSSLEITDGGRVFSREGNLATHASSSSNAVLISGTGSEWLVDGFMRVGRYGSGNVLRVSDGALLGSGSGRLGAEAGSDGSRAFIDGTGSRWTNEFMLAVGNYGSGNSMTISNGGEVHNNTGLIGRYEGADNNSVMVTGEGSVWSNRLLVGVGYRGSDNVLTITDRGRVYSNAGKIGWDTNAWNNTALVSGEGSVWTNAGGLFVGSYGSMNSLVITNGGKVYNSLGNVGRYESALSNRVIVTGQGSQWNSQRLVVSPWGSHNALEILDGGFVGSTTGYVGRYEVAGFNTATVSGSDSVWSNSHALYVGEFGHDNCLVVSNGGYVENAAGYIGYDAVASGNSATIDGASSYWFNRSGVDVGYAGSGNSMMITNGGVVQTFGNNSIGYEASAMSNKVVVSGQHSAWGVGVMVPRVAVLNPSIPGGGSGSVIDVGVIQIGQPPLIEYPLIVTNGGSLVSGGEGISISNSNIISINDGTFTGGSGGMVIASATTNMVNVRSSGSVWTSGSSLTVGTGGASNHLDIANGVSVLEGDLYPGAIIDVSISNLVIVPPTQYRYEMTLGNLAVGHAGSFNTLEIEDGGLVASHSAVVGETSNAWFNAVSVTGTNSEFRVYRDLSLGGRMSPLYVMMADGWQNDWIDGGRGNSLYVDDGGLVSVGRNLHNRNYSSVTIDPGGTISVASNYVQDATSVLRFGVETNAAGAPLNAMVSVGGTAEFEKGAQIEMASNVGQLQFDTFYTNKIVEADKLVVAGVEHADSLDLEQLEAFGSLVDVIFWENEQDIYGFVGRRYLHESAGFDTNSMMGRLAKEIDDMSLLGDTAASQTINLLNGLDGSQQHEQLTQQYTRGTPNYLHAEALTEGMNQIKKQTLRQARQETNVPEGAAGPYRPDQGLKGWVRPYGSWSERDAQDGFEGYDHNIYGTIVGFDLPLESALLGVAGGYGRSVIDQDDGDHSRAKTGYGVIYLNFGTQDWFSQVNVAYGRSKVEQESGTVFGNEAEFDASHMAALFGGGRELRFAGDRLLLTPEGSARWTHYYQQAYTEESPMGVARDVDLYERDSLLSRLGASLALQQEYDTVVVKPEIRAFWLHEFNDDEDGVDYQLVNGTGRYQYEMAAPESDVLEAGTGISCLFHDELEVIFDVDWRFGRDYSAYTVSGRAVFEF